MSAGAGLSALIVDDDEDFRASVAALVAREGYQTREAGTGAGAREELESAPVQLVLLDLALPDVSGMELLREAAARDAQTEFVVITGNADVESAIGALRAGALDYLRKPIDRSRLESVLAHVARTAGLKREVSALREELRDLGRFGRMVGRSAAMQEVYDLIARVAPTSSTVFVTGESGTGKELVADAVHRLSSRKDGPLLALNCGAVSPALIESELFGHEKGSFTGAASQRRGYFEEADGGTIFLDEVTEMPIELQVKLLRVLETGTITRVGATGAIDVDVRVVTASNRDPAEAVKDGKLREDLLYRLNVFPIHLPRLLERADDLELLGRAFLAEINLREQTSKRLSDEAVRHLYRLPWPGNVRELRNVIERAAILADEGITPAELPPLPASGCDTNGVSSGSEAFLQVRTSSSIAEVERRLILATLEELDGDKKRASERLGISMKTLYNRLKVYEAARTGDFS